MDKEKLKLQIDKLFWDLVEEYGALVSTSMILVILKQVLNALFGVG